LDELKERTAKELAEMKQTHNGYVDQLTSKHKQALRDTEDAWDRKYQDLDQYLNGKINGLKEEQEKLKYELGETKDNLKWVTGQKNDLESLVKQLKNDMKSWEIKYDECEKNCELKIKNKELEMESFKLEYEQKEKRMRAELDRLLKEN